MAKMDGWQALVAGLEKEGIPVVFGLPGNARHLYDALYHSSSVKAVLVRHETSGAFMAMAWARVTNRPAVAFGCPGPGVANMVPAVLEAYSGCTPMLVIGVRASTRTEGMGAFQETDHIGMMKPITKWAATIERTDRTNWYLRRAIQIATSGQPGPVYLEFPADLGTTETEHDEYRLAPIPPTPAADPDQIDQVGRMIAQAKRPLIVCGGGAVLSDAGPALTALIDDFGIPVQVTPAGRGVIGESHPLFCGLVGLYRTTFPRQLYEESDLLITIGSRMEEFQSGQFKFFPEGARLVQIDIEPFELGRNWLPDVAIQADAANSIRQLHQELIEINYQPDADRIADVRQRRVQAIQAAADDARETGWPLPGRHIVHEINRVFGDNTILVKENGGADLWSYYWPYYQSFDAGCVIPPAEQTAMGYGVVGAIAAKLARPDRQVVCTTGDSAFQMAMHEIATAVQEDAPVTWVVLNDGNLGWVRWGQEKNLGGRIIATEYDPVFDFVAVAKAAGCDGERVTEPEGLGPALERAKEANRNGIPYVIDVPVDQSDKHDEFIHFHEVAR